MDNQQTIYRRIKTLSNISVLLVVLFFVGCSGIPTPEERQARRDQESVRELFRPGDQKPRLPDLNEKSNLTDFIKYALLNHPKVESSYYDWMASVERITTARSLPDPRLTFESDIADIVMSLVPGFMVDLPGPGKLRAAANVSSAETEARYYSFESSILEAAFAVKKAYYQMHFLDSRIAVNRKTLDLLNDLETLARSQNEVGKVTLQDVLRAQIEKDRLQTEIANLEDSRKPLLALFKGALGLTSEERLTVFPQRFESTDLNLSSEQLLEKAFSRNPRLKMLEAEVRRADASLTLAYKARVPDFSVGLEADAKAFPVIFTPQFSATLPIWRDKIAAQIAEAEAGKRASEAQLSSAQINLAIEFAEKSFMFRESSRNLSLLQERLIPKARQSLEVARTGYLSGQIDFLNLINAEQTLLGFQLNEVEAMTRRELVLAELSLLVVGQIPNVSPVLSKSQDTKFRNKNR